MTCPLGRGPESPCPRKNDGCLACLDDLEERAGHVAHHLGLGFPPLSRDSAMQLAVEQARASMGAAEW
jgi:hypothetical protein